MGSTLVVIFIVVFAKQFVQESANSDSQRRPKPRSQNCRAHRRARPCCFANADNRRIQRPRNHHRHTDEASRSLDFGIQFPAELQ